MILVDSSVWIDHLRSRDERLSALLEAGHVLCHPFVIGEVALGRLKHRDMVVGALKMLPSAVAASDEETLTFIDRNALDGAGVGYVDIHLLAAVRLTRHARLWTRDRRLHSVAVEMGLAAEAA